MTNRAPRPFPRWALIAFLVPFFVFAQSPPPARVYQKSKSDVEKALQQLHSSLGGRLPILDGFVGTDQPLDGYSRGYYQCSVQVTPNGSGDTSVRVAAKITAWYTGSAFSQAGYRVLPSNGRLEADIFDRLDAALGSNASERNMPGPLVPSSKIENPRHALLVVPRSNPETMPPPSAPVPHGAAPSANGTSTAFRAAPGGAARESPGAPVANSVSPVPAELANEDLASLQKRREQAEQRAKDLNVVIQNLEEIQREQTNPSDLAVVKRQGTPVVSGPLSTSHVLFRADVGDEFQIIEKQENWVHVQISGASRGWLKRTELDLTDSALTSRANANVDGTEGSLFRVSREETKPYPGNWEPLRGKTVRIVWVEPASISPTSSADAKRTFAITLLRKTYQEILSASPPEAGVVIVFDSADGGQISATTAALKDWQAGSLPETSFWKQCAVDPPELLEDSSKAIGGSF